MSADDGKPGRRRLSEEERALWGRITGSVKPLRHRPLAAPAAASGVPATPTPMGPAVRAPGRVAAPATRAEPGLEPLDRRLRTRLARGTEVIDARIDLHGLTQSEAHAALLAFLRRAQE